jgi:hypothetical protein
VLLAGAVAFGVAACASDPAASFDPAGACSTDGRMAGAYPELEARIPATYEGRGPDTLDSGRHCTAKNLGSLVEAGVTQVRFGGGTWGFGGIRAAALVVFQAPGLEASHVATFYAQSARTSNRTEIIAETTVTVAGRTGHRLDTKTGERIQTVVVWPAAEPDNVNIVITNDLPDPKIQAAIDAFGGD